MEYLLSQIQDLGRGLMLAVELETFRTAEREQSIVAKVMHTSPEEDLTESIGEQH